MEPLGVWGKKIFPTTRHSFVSFSRGCTTCSTMKVPSGKKIKILRDEDARMVLMGMKAKMRSAPRPAPVGSAEPSPPVPKMSARPRARPPPPVSEPSIPTTSRVIPSPKGAVPAVSRKVSSSKRAVPAASGETSPKRGTTGAPRVRPPRKRRPKRSGGHRRGLVRLPSYKRKVCSYLVQFF